MKRWMSVLLSALTAVSCVTAAQAAAPDVEKSYLYEVTSQVHTGDVDVELNEYQKDASGAEVPYDDTAPRQVLPGEKVDKIVKVRNLAQDAYVRLQVTYLDRDGCSAYLQDENLDIDEELWQKYGDWWYYRPAGGQPLARSQEVTFMTGFQVDRNLGNEVEEGAFEISLTVQAVQAKNFTPRYEEDGTDPWFGTPIQLCEHVDHSTRTPEQHTFMVEFAGGADGFVKTDQDFFSNWETMMPGDTLTGEVTVKSTYDGPVNLYFYPRNREEDAGDGLLSALKLKLERLDTAGSPTEVLFEGNLSAAAEPILLKTYQKGDTEKIRFTVTVPTWLQNGYANRSPKTTWVFQADVLKDAYVLPYTGGRGIWGFTAGGLLLAAAGMLRIRRREDRLHA